MLRAKLPGRSVVRIAQREINALRAAHDQPGGWQWSLVQRAQVLLQVTPPDMRSGTTAEIDHLRTQVDQLRTRITAMEERELFEAWIRGVPLWREPLVSIVLCTKGERPEFLRQAIGSVLSQMYPHFELILVVPPGVGINVVLDADLLQDQRVHLHTHPPGYAIGGARNFGMSKASGEYVVYADDDNTMGVAWLKAVVWSLLTDTETDVVYGIRLHESIGTGTDGHGQPAPGPAFWWFERQWEPDSLLQFNPIDTQVLGHRAGLAEARWDEDLPGCVDWELAIRLTKSGRVKPLPVLACTYTTSAPGRITGSYDTNTIDVVRARARQARRPKLLSVTHSFPRFTETYVESELAALADTFDCVYVSEWGPQEGCLSDCRGFGAGSDVFAANSMGGVSPAVRRAIESEQPDVVLFHFGDVAARQRPLVEEFGLPYAVRIHSYDWQVPDHLGFGKDPLHIGTWAYEHLLPKEGASIFPLPALCHNADKRPIPASARSGFVYAGSCLPKRNWGVFAEICRAVAPMRSIVFLGTAHGDTDAELIGSCAANLATVGPAASVHTDRPLADVLEALSTAAAVLYLPPKNHPVGNPRSVVEGLICGAIPVLPESPESRAFVGSHGRYYRSAEEAVDVLLAVEAEAQQIGHGWNSARAESVRWALDRFAGGYADRFAQQLHSTLAQFRHARSHR
jgi:hypothetical protein